MNELEKTITTVEIAGMLETTHFDVLKKLEGAKDRKGIIQTMCDHHLSVADYFIESEYADAQGKPRKCYLVTKIGCDFLANKFTGEKGILFTAKYVKRFRDMESAIISLDGLSPELQAIFTIDKKQTAIEHRMEKLEDTMNIDYGQQQVLRKEVNSRVTYVLESYLSLLIGQSKVFLSRVF